MTVLISLSLINVGYMFWSTIQNFAIPWRWRLKQYVIQMNVTLIPGDVSYCKESEKVF
jgi:hypothetical protein